MSMTTELPELVLGSDLDPDDPVKAHILDCPDDKPSAEAWLTEARVFGLEVTAICGYRWVPTRDPQKHPLCADCLDEARRRLNGADSETSR